jgi:hypothetical protein
MDCCGLQALGDSSNDSSQSESTSLDNLRKDDQTITPKDTLVDPSILVKKNLNF